MKLGSHTCGIVENCVFFLCFFSCLSKMSPEEWPDILPSSPYLTNGKMVCPTYAEMKRSLNDICPVSKSNTIKSILINYTALQLMFIHFFFSSMIPLVNGIVHPKKENSVMITHPHVVQNL